MSEPIVNPRLTVALPTDLFRGVVPFTAVAEARSFRKAAARLGVSAAAVSKAVATLEAELGVTLLERTSRSVALTRVGEEFLGRCREAIGQVLGAREAASAARRQPQGEVALTLPFVAAPRVLIALRTLTARYPRLRFRLDVSDRLTRLRDENLDVAIRVGALDDSALVARRLSGTRWVTCASPAYLGRHGVPSAPADLAAHDCLKFVGPSGRPREWTFRAIPVMGVSGSLLVDQGHVVVEATIAGFGICQVLDFTVADALRTGTLVEVLADHAAVGPPIHALAPPGKASSPNVRACFAALAEAFH